MIALESAFSEEAISFSLRNKKLLNKSSLEEGLSLQIRLAHHFSPITFEVLGGEEVVPALKYRIWCLIQQASRS